MPSSRERLRIFLDTCAADDLSQAFQSAWLEEIIPGIGKIVGCEQGQANHCEGDVAVHTALVFENLIQVCRKQLRREPDFVERVAALLHDWKKPVVQRKHSDGTITFERHEELAAAEIPTAARTLELTAEETAKLRFLVAEHGNAHSFPELPAEKQDELRSSPYVESLCVFQMADAMSCRRRDGGHLPVHWEDLHPKGKTIALVADHSLRGAS